MSQRRSSPRNKASEASASADPPPKKKNTPPKSKSKSQPVPPPPAQSQPPPSAAAAAASSSSSQGGGGGSQQNSIMNYYIKNVILEDMEQIMTYSIVVEDDDEPNNRRWWYPQMDIKLNRLLAVIQLILDDMNDWSSLLFSLPHPDEGIPLAIIYVDLLHYIVKPWIDQQQQVNSPLKIQFDTWKSYCDVFAATWIDYIYIFEDTMVVRQREYRHALKLIAEQQQHQHQQQQKATPLCSLWSKILQVNDVKQFTEEFSRRGGNDDTFQTLFNVSIDEWTRINDPYQPLTELERKKLQIVPLPTDERIPGRILLKHFDMYYEFYSIVKWIIEQCTLEDGRLSLFQDHFDTALWPVITKTIQELIASQSLKLGESFFTSFQKTTNKELISLQYHYQVVCLWQHLSKVGTRNCYLVKDFHRYAALVWTNLFKYWCSKTIIVNVAGGEEGGEGAVNKTLQIGIVNNNKAIIRSLLKDVRMKIHTKLNKIRNHWHYGKAANLDIICERLKERVENEWQPWLKKIIGPTNEYWIKVKNQWINSSSELIINDQQHLEQAIHCLSLYFQWQIHYRDLKTVSNIIRQCVEQSSSLRNELQYFGRTEDSSLLGFGVQNMALNSARAEHCAHLVTISILGGVLWSLGPTYAIVSQMSNSAFITSSLYTAAMQIRRCGKLAQYLTSIMGIRSQISTQARAHIDNVSQTLFLSSVLFRRFILGSTYPLPERVDPLTSTVFQSLDCALWFCTAMIESGIRHAKTQEQKAKFERVNTRLQKGRYVVSICMIADALAGWMSRLFGLHINSSRIATTGTVLNAYDRLFTTTTVPLITNETQHRIDVMKDVLAEPPLPETNVTSNSTTTTTTTNDTKFVQGYDTGAALGDAAVNTTVNTLTSAAKLLKQTGQHAIEGGLLTTHSVVRNLPTTVDDLKEKTGHALGSIGYYTGTVLGAGGQMCSRTIDIGSGFLNEHFREGVERNLLNDPERAWMEIQQATKTVTAGPQRYIEEYTFRGIRLGDDDVVVETPPFTTTTTFANSSYTENTTTREEPQDKGGEEAGGGGESANNTNSSSGQQQQEQYQKEDSFFLPLWTSTDAIVEGIKELKKIGIGMKKIMMMIPGHEKDALLSAIPCLRVEKKCTDQELLESLNKFVATRITVDSPGTELQHAILLSPLKTPIGAILDYQFRYDLVVQQSLLSRHFIAAGCPHVFEKSTCDTIMNAIEGNSGINLLNAIAFCETFDDLDFTADVIDEASTMAVIGAGVAAAGISQFTFSFAPVATSAILAGTVGSAVAISGYLRSESGSGSGGGGRRRRRTTRSASGDERRRAVAAAASASASGSYYTDGASNQRPPSPKKRLSKEERKKGAADIEKLAQNIETAANGDGVTAKPGSHSRSSSTTTEPAKPLIESIQQFLTVILGTGGEFIAINDFETIFYEISRGSSGSSSTAAAAAASGVGGKLNDRYRQQQRFRQPNALRQQHFNARKRQSVRTDLDKFSQIFSNLAFAINFISEGPVPKMNELYPSHISKVMKKKDEINDTANASAAATNNGSSTADSQKTFLKRAWNTLKDLLLWPIQKYLILDKIKKIRNVLSFIFRDFFGALLLIAKRAIYLCVGQYLIRIGTYISTLRIDWRDPFVLKRLNAVEESWTLLDDLMTVTPWYRSYWSLMQRSHTAWKTIYETHIFTPSPSTSSSLSQSPYDVQQMKTIYEEIMQPFLTDTCHEMVAMFKEKLTTQEWITTTNDVNPPSWITRLLSSLYNNNNQSICMLKSNPKDYIEQTLDHFLLPFGQLLALWSQKTTSTTTTSSLSTEMKSQLIRSRELLLSLLDGIFTTIPPSVSISNVQIISSNRIGVLLLSQSLFHPSLLIRILESLTRSDFNFVPLQIKGGWSLDVIQDAQECIKQVNDQVQQIQGSILRTFTLAFEHIAFIHVCILQLKKLHELVPFDEHSIDFSRYNTILELYRS